MKKLASFLIIFTILFSLPGCGSSYTSSSTTSVSKPTTTEYVAPTKMATIAPTATPAPEDGLKSDGNIHVYLIGDGEHVDTPESSFINWLEYYPDCDHLLIRMNGKTTYAYDNISQSMWQAFKAADSKGSYFNKNIKNDSAYWVNDYTGSGSNFTLEYCG